MASGYLLGGESESPASYIRYCTEECDWSTFRFAPKSREERRKALRKLLSSPKLKGKLDERERACFEAQIK